MAPPDDDDHDCGWKAYAKAQDRKLAEVMARLEELERRAKGHKSEKRKRSKLPAPVPAPAIEPAETAAKRAALAELRDAKLDVELTQVRVPDGQRSCPSCSKALRPVGEGKLSSVIEYVASRCSSTASASPSIRASVSASSAGTATASQRFSA